MAIKFAHFSVGDTVFHRLFGYRGVIVDADPLYLGTDEWYSEHATSRPPKDQPWYHVLVDGSETHTYVSERNLEVDGSGEPIDHPEVNEYFASFANGSYTPRNLVN